MSRISQAEKPYLRKDLPDVQVGDTVEVDLKVKEGDKERIQTFTGTVIGIRGGGLAKTFTVRRIVQGEGVERILPWHSPLIDALRAPQCCQTEQPGANGDKVADRSAHVQELDDCIDVHISFSSSPEFGRSLPSWSNP